MSRIYYRGKFYDYPIVADERAAQPRARRGGALRGVVPVGADPPAEGHSRRSRGSSRRGSAGVSTEHFFKTQSEKVWGVPCTEIQADWGAQRIKDLSLFRAVWEALKPKRITAQGATRRSRSRA